MDADLFEFEKSMAFERGGYVEPKHSGLGIASFIISCVLGVAMFALLVVVGIMESSTPGGLDEESPEAIVLGLCILAVGFLEFLAIGLGIAGLLQDNRKKVFAVLGTVFSSLTILAVVGLIALGSTME